MQIFLACSIGQVVYRVDALNQYPRKVKCLKLCLILHRLQTPCFYFNIAMANSDKLYNPPARLKKSKIKNLLPLLQLEAILLTFFIVNFYLQTILRVSEKLRCSMVLLEPIHQRNFLFFSPEHQVFQPTYVYWIPHSHQRKC